MSRGRWVVVKEGKHVQLEGVVLLPASNGGDHHGERKWIRIWILKFDKFEL